MMNKPKLRLLLFVVTTIASLYHTSAQTLSGQSAGRPILTAVPFVAIAPDSRSTGMGDVGVATSPDINSVHWNNGKLAFIDKSYGGAASYSPWLRNIVPDMGLYYLSGFYKIDKVQTVGTSFRYFDLGKLFRTGTGGEDQGVENPNELAFDATYSRKLSNNWGIGVTARFISSNLVGSIGGQDAIGTSVAVDLGTYYTNDITLGATNANLSFGAHISNIGQKISYGFTEIGNNPASDGAADFIPTNLRLGTALKLELDPFNSLTIAVDLNKLMVPTPPVYAADEDGQPILDNNNNQVIEKGKDPDRNLIAGMFGSFTDAPDGFSEELKEIMISSGVEYWYRDIFAARLGYFYENEDKGGRRYLTMGIGIRYQTFGLDFSYLIPGEQNNPLSDAVRFTLLWQVTKESDREN